MNRKPALALLLGLLTAAGIWLLTISTPSGLGLIDDAISYIAAARALLAGQGFTRIWLATGLEPITHWPPGFPATLAAISFLFKIDPYRSARVLNVLVFGGNAALLALLGFKMTRSYIASVLLSLLFLSNASILQLHAQALSEPLYIFVSLLAFLAFVRAFDSDLEGRVRWEHKWLFLAGFLTALSYITRYAALSLLATFIVAIFILRPTWRTRLISFGFFLLGAMPPILAWMLRNKLIGGTATNRAIKWHPVTLENTQRGLQDFFAFLTPWTFFHTAWYENYTLLAIILGIFTLALLGWLLQRGLKKFLRPQDTAQPALIPFTTALYIFGYMGSLLVSLSLFDAATPLNDRILSPVYVAFLVILVYFSQRLFEQSKVAGKLISFGVIASLLATFVVAQVREVKLLQQTPTGFASWRWRESVVMEAIRDLPEDTIVYSNQAPAVYFWTDRPAVLVLDVEYTRKALRNDNTVLAFFFSADTDSLGYQAYLAALTEGLTPIVKSGLGYIYIDEQ